MYRADRSGLFTCGALPGPSGTVRTSIRKDGPELVSHDDGLHGVIFGKYNILACMMPAFDLAQLVGDLGAARQIAAAAQKAPQ